MSYATQTDLQVRLGAEDLGIVADTEGVDKKNVAAIDAALLDGCGKIDAAVEARYALPLAAPVPQILVRINVDLAVYYLARTWDRMSDLIIQRHAEACADLMLIAKGTIGLGLASPPATLGIGADFSSNPRLFTRDTQKGLL